MLPLTASSRRLPARGSAEAAGIAIPRRMVLDLPNAHRGAPDRVDG